MKTYPYFFFATDKKTKLLKKFWCDIVKRTSDQNITVVRLANGRTKEVITKLIIKNYDKIPSCTTS